MANSEVSEVSDDHGIVYVALVVEMSVEGSIFEVEVSDIFSHAIGYISLLDSIGKSANCHLLKLHQVLSESTCFI